MLVAGVLALTAPVRVLVAPVRVLMPLLALAFVPPVLAASRAAADPQRAAAPHAADHGSGPAHHPAHHPAAPGADAPTAIARLLHETFDRPQAKLLVAPIVVVERWAVAGWVQGEQGGRALLARRDDGRWTIRACGGDGLADAGTLAQTGMPDASAQRLAARLHRAESRLPRAQRAKLSLFDGLARFDEGQAHGPTGGADHDAHRAHGAAAAREAGRDLAPRKDQDAAAGR